MIQLPFFNHHNVEILTRKNQLRIIHPGLDGLCIKYPFTAHVHWLVVSNMAETFSISYMGCHPSH